MANVGNENEIWIKIPGNWDHEYFINKNGIVKYLFESRQKNKYNKAINRFKYPKIHHYKIGYGQGYFACNLSKNKTPKISYIHRLVGLVFVPNPENKPQINHIDGNSINNDISNLEWVTAMENIHHAWDTGLCRPHTNNHRRITDTDCEEIRRLYSSGIEQSEIGKMFDCGQSHISRIISKTHSRRKKTTQLPNNLKIAI